MACRFWLLVYYFGFRKERDINMQQTLRPRKSLSFYGPSRREARRAWRARFRIKPVMHDICNKSLLLKPLEFLNLAPWVAKCGMQCCWQGPIWRLEKHSACICQILPVIQLLARVHDWYRSRVQKKVFFPSSKNIYLASLWQRMESF